MTTVPWPDMLPRSLTVTVTLMTVFDSLQAPGRAPPGCPPRFSYSASRPTRLAVDLVVVDGVECFRRQDRQRRAGAAAAVVDGATRVGVLAHVHQHLEDGEVTRGVAEGGSPLADVDRDAADRRRGPDLVAAERRGAEVHVQRRGERLGRQHG